MNGHAFAAEIGLCLLLAGADGEISERELSVLTTSVGRLVGDEFDPVALGLLVDEELRTIDVSGIDAYVQDLPARIPVPRRLTALAVACTVACADGLSEEEEERLREVSGALGIPFDAVLEASCAEEAAAGAPMSLRFERDRDEEHLDPPDARTALVAERLSAAGWSDPLALLRDAGINVGASGALTREFEATTGCIFRLEHHTCDGSLRLIVSRDDEDDALEFELLPDGRENAALSALMALQNEPTLASIEARLPNLSAHARVYLKKEGGRTELRHAEPQP